MKADDIVGTVAILFFIGLATFVSAFWPFVVGLIVLGIAWVWYDQWLNYQPWHTFDPPREISSNKSLRAKGRMNEGYFALYQENAKPGKGYYPIVLTLVITDRFGKLKSSVATVVSDSSRDGSVFIGTYHGQPVKITSGTTPRGWSVDMTNPDRFPNWQVYPPTGKEPLIPIEL